MGETTIGLLSSLLGSETSIDEQGTAAYKTVELDDWFDGEPSQNREVMGEESDEFKSLFESYELLEGGIDSGFQGGCSAGCGEGTLC